MSFDILRNRHENRMKAVNKTNKMNVKSYSESYEYKANNRFQANEEIKLNNSKLKCKHENVTSQ